MERWWNDPERGKRGIRNGSLSFLNHIQRLGSYITQNTDFHQKGQTADVVCGNNRCFCENYMEYTEYTMCR